MTLLTASLSAKMLLMSSSSKMARYYEKGQQACYIYYAAAHEVFDAANIDRQSR